MRSYMDHTVLPANYTMPAFTPQPQSITALWLVLILPSHATEDRRLSRPGWLVTYRIKMPPSGVEPDTVTHPSTNRAERKLTSLIDTNALPLRQAATSIIVVLTQLADQRDKRKSHRQCCAGQ